MANANIELFSFDAEMTLVDMANSKLYTTEVMQQVLTVINNQLKFYDDEACTREIVDNNIKQEVFEQRPYLSVQILIPLCTVNSCTPHLSNKVYSKHKLSMKDLITIETFEELDLANQNRALDKLHAVRFNLPEFDYNARVAVRNQTIATIDGRQGTENEKLAQKQAANSTMNQNLFNRARELNLFPIEIDDFRRDPIYVKCVVSTIITAIKAMQFEGTNLSLRGFMKGVSTLAGFQNRIRTVYQSLEQEDSKAGVRRVMTINGFGGLPSLYEKTRTGIDYRDAVYCIDFLDPMTYEIPTSIITASNKAIERGSRARR